MPEEEKESANKHTPETIFEDITDNLYKMQVEHLNRQMAEEMAEYPGLSDYVASKMGLALIPAEAVLVGETSLVVFRYFRKNQIKPEPLPEVEIAELGENNIKDVSAMSIAMEDDIRSDDKNQIFIELQKRMEGKPELSEFVANIMKRSVSLEEANLIGKTALVVHEIMDHPMINK